MSETSMELPFDRLTEHLEGRITALKIVAPHQVRGYELAADDVAMFRSEFEIEQSEDATHKLRLRLGDVKNFALALIRGHEGDSIATDIANALLRLVGDNAEQASHVPRVEYSSDLRGVFYVYLKGGIPPGGVKTTRQIMVNVDYDENGEPVGIEYGT